MRSAVIGGIVSTIVRCPRCSPPSSPPPLGDEESASIREAVLLNCATLATSVVCRRCSTRMLGCVAVGLLASSLTPREGGCM